MKLWCCQCQAEVDARLTCGAEVYPHRRELARLPRWICDVCKNHVGTHHKTSDPTRPLGCIPTEEIRRARVAIHKLIDPVWRSGRMRRSDIYQHLSDKIGREYHTADIRTLDEARLIYVAARDFIRSHEAPRGAA